MQTKAVIEYWQSCQQQEALHAVTPAQVKEFWYKISAQERIQGRLNDQAIIDALLARGNILIVAPFYAQRGENYFFPFLLSVELTLTGEFRTQYATSLPIFPKTVLEPSALHPISLGNAENLSNYTIINPPLWHEEITALGWDNQLSYAQQVLKEVCGDSWLQNLNQVGYMLQEGALCFALNDLCQPAVMDTKLLSKHKKVEIIDAARNSGKSEYIANKIFEAWIDAGVKQALPPQYVWMIPGVDLKYANIFDNVTSIIESNSDGSDLSASVSAAHAHLTHQFAAYSRGKQLIYNWQHITEQLDDKYSDKGGIDARINQLRANFKEAKVHNRHIQVLFSIWLRQLDLIPAWSSVFDFVPTMQNRRLQRLYQFFKQNFPGVSVTGMKLKQMHEIMVDKKRRAENTERFVGDALHQVENDLLQESIVREKCLQWSMEQKLVATDMFGIAQQIPSCIWDKVLYAAKQYWQLAFMHNNGYDEFLTCTPSKIDLLIVEHAEYVSPMLAGELLAKCQRALIFGNYNPLCVPRFSAQLDYELAKQFNLASCDEEFEDMQFDGIAGSVGNLWNLAAQGREADQIFSAVEEHEISYEYIDVNSTSENYLGSMINSAEVITLLAWLDKNQHLIGDLAIYTTFSGQAHQIAEALLDARIANIPVLMIQEPSFNKYSTVVFLPVYSAQDVGPYCFDRGSEMLDNMVANVKQRLMVIGEMRIFKPQLHSASGKFAKLLFNNSINSQKIITSQEVNCV